MGRHRKADPLEGPPGEIPRDAWDLRGQFIEGDAMALPWLPDVPKRVPCGGCEQTQRQLDASRQRLSILLRFLVAHVSEPGTGRELNPAATSAENFVLRELREWINDPPVVQ